MTTLAADLLTTDDQLVALYPAWHRLWHRAPAATPFQSPDWLLPWWRHFGTGMPRVAVLRESCELVGILPLYRLDEPPARKLLPIGAGITDYQDALLAPGLPPTAGDDLLRTALRDATADGITSCDLIDLPPGATLRGITGPPDWRLEWQVADPCPVLNIPAGADRLADVLPPALLRSYRLNRNRMARAGACAVEVATAATLPRLLDELFRLHEARWSGQGVLGDDRVRTFHRDAAPALLAAERLRLYVLRLDDAIVAAMHVLVDGGRRLLCYLSGYDRSMAREGPGSVLLGAVIEQAVREGFSEVHFLRGGERYKYEWGGIDRMNAACRLTPT